MDIPQLLSKMADADAENLFSALIKPVSLTANERKKDLSLVYLDLDLNLNQVIFEARPYREGLDEQGYHYFGNNPAAAKQVYIVRDAGSILNFWLGKPNGILQNLYEFIDESPLKGLLKECQINGLFDENGICDSAIRFRESLGEVEFEVKRGKTDKGLYINGDKVNPDKFLNACLEDETDGKFVLIIPRIIKGSEPPVCISKDEAYLTAITKLLQGESQGSVAVCHLCGKTKNDINTIAYTTKLSKASIGKVFVTTTVNYSPLFNKKNHQKNYSLCKACYEKILFGEKAVMRDYKIRIAGEDCTLLFDGLIKPLEIKYLPALNAKIDAAFNHKELADWVSDLLGEFEYQDISLYEFHLVFYRTDGKATNIIKTIESISQIRFEEVEMVFDKVYQERFVDYLKSFTLSSIYHMIPVTLSAKGEQVDIGRVLDIYGGILKGEMIYRSVLFDFAVDALEKGIRELKSSKLRNYKNLHRLKVLHGKEYGRDIFSAEIVMMYLALFEVLQELKILDREMRSVAEMESVAVQYPEYIQSKEQFLAIHRFNMAQKKLFYMGVLAHLIGRAQYKQGHKTKPILDKIVYSGMNENDVLDFYLELQAKGRQYKNILLNSKTLGHFEQIEGCIARNLGEVDQKSRLSEKENVFYIKAGYSFCVLEALNKKGEGENSDDNDKE